MFLTHDVLQDRARVSREVKLLILARHHLELTPLSPIHVHVKVHLLFALVRVLAFALGAA